VGDRAAGSTVDRDEHVLGGCRAQQGARHLGRHRRRRRHDRSDHGRTADPLCRLAVHLLPERADRGGLAAARPADRAREPARGRAAPVRRTRCGHGDGRAAAARVRDLNRAAGRLVDDAHGVAARSIRRRPRDVPGHRDARRGTADAAAHLPSAHGGGGERGRAPARRQLLRLHLRRHALHAAGARLLGTAGRHRLAGGVPDVGRPGRPLADARHAPLARAGDGLRDGTDRRRHPLGDAGAGARPLLERWPRRSSSPEPAPPSRSSRSRSQASPGSPNRRPDSPPGCSTPRNRSAARSASRSPPPSQPHT
jgi:hypothetical protein